jgi:enoyl-CoA hydratase/carnithine racemase
MLQTGPELAACGPPATPSPPSLEPAVLMERNGARLDLTLNRPRRHNAFSAEMRDALVEALRVVVGDASISEVVVRGAGASFSSGGDLEEFGTRPDPATAHAIRSTRNAARLLADCAGRVRFEVHGACIGAGVELPAFAARVVARAGAFFELPEVAMGLVPGAGGTVSIPRRIGRQRTAQFALAGQRVDAETAWRWGLVDDLRT